MVECRRVFALQYNTWLDFAVEVARDAGRIICKGSRRPFTVTSKGRRDLLTDVDLAAERSIIAAIHENFPDHDILSEETPPDARASSYCWVVDPLDGTGNFTRGYPCFSTSIALTVDDEPVVGVVYDPMRDHLFAACKGGGATLNGRPLHVSGTATLPDGLIGLDWARQEALRRGTVRVVAHLAEICGTLRICGSAALGICYVGAGWWDAYWHLSLRPWDAAGGALIVREAGGHVTDLTGARWRPRKGPCLASNGHLHADFLAQVNAALDCT